MRTWHETILYIRTLPDFKELVEKAYFEEDLQLNVERFRKSEEYQQTLVFLKQYAPKAKTILDIGSGNGISAVALALDGYKVTASEPDPSDTVGAGAIQKLKQIYKLDELSVYQEFAENIQFPESQFDVVYVRQAMHHANVLNQFVKNLASLLKQGGILMTVRDHVIYNRKDKDWFLESHPLQKFYGGENAYTSSEYRAAIEKAGLNVEVMLKYYDSIINYFPVTKAEIDQMIERKEKEIRKKVGILSKSELFMNLYKYLIRLYRGNMLNEAQIPGRMYTFIARKG